MRFFFERQKTKNHDEKCFSKKNIIIKHLLKNFYKGLKLL